MSFYNRKNIVVTGAAGLIGHSVINKLLDQGAYVKAILHANSKRIFDCSHPNLTTEYRDLMNIDECKSAVKNMDIVINLAAYLIGALRQKEHPTSLIRNNLTLTINMIDAACQEGVNIFGYVGSSTMYPEADYPIAEYEAFTGDPSKAYEGIGWVWRYCEKACNYFHNTTNTKFALTRTSAVYGPYDNFSSEKRHVIPDLIVKAHNRIDPFEVWGNGSQIRDFIYVDDMVDGLLLTIEKHSYADAINIASGKGTSIRELVKIILEKSGYMPSLVFDVNKPTAVQHRILNIGKAKTILNWQPSTSLADGIEKTIKWYNSIQ